MARLRTHNNRAKRALRRQLSAMERQHSAVAEAAAADSEVKVLALATAELPPLLSISPQGRQQELARIRRELFPLKQLHATNTGEQSRIHEPYNLFNSKPDCKTSLMTEIKEQNIKPPAREFISSFLPENKIYKSYQR